MLSEKGTEETDEERYTDNLRVTELRGGSSDCCSLRVTGRAGGGVPQMVCKVQRELNSLHSRE